MNIASDKAVDDLAGLLFANRHSLRSFKMSFRLWRWLRSPDIELDSLTQGQIWDYMEWWGNDQLLPILRDVVEVGDPLNLHTLEIHRVGTINVPRWLQAFNFQTVQNFALIDTQFGSWRNETEELWRSFKKLGVSLQYLVTDAPNEELAHYVGSFQGLEGFLICDVDGRSCPGPDGLLHQLSGHFSTLRHLFISIGCHGGKFFRPRDIRAVVDGCFELEELGWGMQEEYLVRSSGTRIHFPDFSLY